MALPQESECSGFSALEANRANTGEQYFRDVLNFLCSGPRRAVIRLTECAFAVAIPQHILGIRDGCKSLFSKHLHPHFRQDPGVLYRTANCDSHHTFLPRLHRIIKPSIGQPE